MWKKSCRHFQLKCYWANHCLIYYSLWIMQDICFTALYFIFFKCECIFLTTGKQLGISEWITDVSSASVWHVCMSEHKRSSLGSTAVFKVRGASLTIFTIAPQKPQDGPFCRALKAPRLAQNLMAIEKWSQGEQRGRGKKSRRVWEIMKVVSKKSSAVLKSTGQEFERHGKKACWELEGWEHG